MAQHVALSNVEAAIKYLEEDGGVILTGFTSQDDLERVNCDAEPHITAILEQASQSVPRTTTRCSRLFGRSITAREKWLQQNSLLEIINHFLRSESVVYHEPENSGDSSTISTDAILSAASTLDIGPGVKAQTLHRDDFIWQQTHENPCIDGYKIGRDICMGLLVPGVPVTRENGATQFVPGSHLWGHCRRPREEEVALAEMQTGEAFLFLGSTVHGGGGNKTNASRPVHGFFFCRSWLRPEENQHLWWREEEIRKWSQAAQKQAGYVRDNPYLGHCNDIDPIDLFRSSNPMMQERAA
ncbi:MAG: hypothetical protein Q9167_001822 [Letrouitia subvulpina]